MTQYTTLLAGTQTFFQAFGLCTFSLRRPRTASPTAATAGRLLLICWPAAHAAVLAALAAYVARHPAYVFFDNDAIGALTDIIQLAAPFAAHFLCLAEAVRTRRLRRRLRQRLQRADRELERACVGQRFDASNAGAMWRYLRKATALFALCAATETRIVAAIGANAVWQHLWSVLLFSLVAQRVQHAQLVWHADEVRWRLQRCAALLEQSAAAVDGDCGGVAEALRRYHSALWLVTEQLNATFGWCTLATVTANFVGLSVNLYWNYVGLYFGSNPFVMESLLGSVPPTLALWVVCEAGDGLQAAAAAIGGQVHRERSGGRFGGGVHRSRLVSAVVRRFSLQVRQLRFALSARGFFDINFDLFKGVRFVITDGLCAFGCVGWSVVCGYERAFSHMFRSLRPSPPTC